jgi:hypothetical protein
MKKKITKITNESLHPLGEKLNKILEVMRDVEESLDTWNIKDCNLRSPLIEADDDTGKIEIVTLIGDYDFRYSVEQFVDRTFEVLDYGSYEHAEHLINFRRQFDEAVLNRLEKYNTKSDQEEVAWAKEQAAIYKKELDGKI